MESSQNAGTKKLHRCEHVCVCVLCTCVCVCVHMYVQTHVHICATLCGTEVFALFLTCLL